jgi:outer membrane protein assembly factor BamB
MNRDSNPSERGAIMRAGLLGLLSAAVLTSPLAAQATGLRVPSQKPQDWTQYRRDPGHGGNNPFETAIDESNVASLTVKWTAQTAGALGGGVQASPSVTGGVVWVLSQDGYLYAFDAQSGAQIAKPQTGGYGSSAPAIVEGRVVVGAVSGVYSFAANCTGACAPLWHADTHTTINPPVTIVGGRVYASNYWGYLDVLDLIDGHTIWSTQINVNDPVFGSASVAHGLVYVPGDYGVLAFSIGCSSGCGPTWVFPTPYAVERTPAVDGDRLFVGDDQGNFFALDAASGTQRWTATVSALPTPAALAGDLVIVGGIDGTLMAFRQSSSGPVAQPIWTVSTGESLFEPVIANGVVYVGSITGDYTHGKLFAFRASDGASLKTWSLNGALESGATVSGGRIYLGTITGKIYAFGF